MIGIDATGQHLCEGDGVPPMAPAAVEDSVTGRFRRIAVAHTDCLAVQDDRLRVSYGQLDAWANGIAGAIEERRTTAREPVALLFRQGATSVAATLGVLAAGRAYVPLDASDPAFRQAAIADEAGARLVLTDRECAPLADALRRADRDVLIVDEGTLAASDPPDVPLGPDSHAYVYFTSGSTGRPKGVLDIHRNVLHNVLRYTATLAIGPADRLSVLQPPAFSGVVSSTFGALLNGAALFPMRAGEQRLEVLAAAIRDRRISIYHSVPSILRSLLAVDAGVFADVRAVRLEGDRATAADVALYRRRFASSCILANGLGTTETGLCRQLRIGRDEPVQDGPLPVGFPVPGVEASVVGADGRPLPRGEVGEIAISSRHLALGYWGRADLTAAAFTADPAAPDVRVYRTGDLGRMRADGCLEYLGRRDGRLKVLGRRVEPGEIEAELLSVPGVSEAVVGTVAGRRGEGGLIAQVVVAPAGPDAGRLRAVLAGRLPAAMVPASIVVVDAISVTPAGKLDRRAPVPVDPPGTAREEQLVALWEAILETDGIGVHDDFFALGGDSLAVAELLAALESQLGRPLSESLLLRAPTVASLATALDAGSQSGRGGVVPLQPRGAGAPLVLVHGSHFGTDVYRTLIGRLGVERPVWGLEAPSGDPPRLGDLAARHAAVLRAAAPAGPHLLAGFCSAAVLAAEVGRHLRAGGAEVELLALIGIDAGDLPSLVTPEARIRHRASRRFVARARRHAARARALERAARPAHHRAAAGGLWAELRTAARRSAVRGPGFPDLGTPGPLPGAAVLLLADEPTARYSVDPAADWRGLAESVRVEVLPGRNDDLLREPLVADLAERLRAEIAAAIPSGR